MSESIITSDLSTEESSQTEVKLRRRGRYPIPEAEKKPKKPRKQNNTREYNREYYHTSKTEITCTCGMLINKRCLNRHLTRRIHEENLKIMAVQNGN